MNAEVYCQILDEDLLDTFEWQELDREEMIFQQDNDPKHTSNRARRWFEENEICVMEWPAQSPDMNPIEHLWNELDRRLRASGHLPTNRDEHWEKILEEWGKIDVEVVRNLIRSMPRRVADLVKAKGGYIRW